VSYYFHWQWCVLPLLPVYMHVIRHGHGLWALGSRSCVRTYLKCCNFRPTGPCGPWMGLYALFRIATGRHERYTAPAQARGQLLGLGLAGTSAAE
jgi:hypothetical protein